METQPKNNSGERLALKSIVITVLVLVLWAATFLIQSLIDERQNRQQEAINEVSSKFQFASKSAASPRKGISAQSGRLFNS